MIRRRRVFYIEGYDPQGPDGYYRLFRREWKRFLGAWSLAGTLGDLVLDSPEIAHWDIEAVGPNWHVTTRYEFLRLERFIGANMARPLFLQIPRALWWMIDDIRSGTLFRIFGAAWRFGVHLILPQVFLIVWLACAIGGGWLVGAIGGGPGGLAAPLALILGAAAGAAIFIALKPLADRWFVIQVTNAWPHMREFARGAPTGYDGPVEVLAHRVVAAARDGDADEILVVSHSGGCVLSPAVMERALELDPDLGRRGPRVVLLTVGSLMPGMAMHPAAERLRVAMRRIAAEASVLWVDCQARKDIMNFWDFDPLEGVGIYLGSARRNPVIWSVRFRDMLSDAAYRSLRYNYFRMHYQFVMANDLRASYDYYMLTCGPLPLADWAVAPEEVFHTFAEDAAYAFPAEPSRVRG